MSDTFSKVEVVTGVARRRRFSTELKVAVVAETMQPGMSVKYVARRHELSPSLIFRWRQLMSEGGKEAVRADDEVVAASELRRLEERVRELEWRGIIAGTLDDQSRFAPSMHVWSSRMVPWLHLADDLPRHAEFTPSA
jgi:transposase